MCVEEIKILKWVGGCVKGDLPGIKLGDRPAQHFFRTDDGAGKVIDSSGDDVDGSELTALVVLVDDMDTVFAELVLLNRFRCRVEIDEEGFRGVEEEKKDCVSCIHDYILYQKMLMTNQESNFYDIEYIVVHI